MTTKDDAIVPIPEQVPAGLSAYARGDYFAAHEHFEDAWRASGEPRSLELHALAQIGAAVHKACTQLKPVPARAIMQRALAKLERVPTSAYGLDLGGLRAEIEIWLRDLEAKPPSVTRRP